MFFMNKIWLLSTAERLGKTFAQGYLGFWMLSAGLANTSASIPSADAFDTLFTTSNLKAGVVMAVLSLATSVGSTPIGVDKSSPSLTVTETQPTLPPTQG